MWSALKRAVPPAPWRSGRHHVTRRECPEGIAQGAVRPCASLRPRAAVWIRHWHLGSRAQPPFFDILRVPFEVLEKRILSTSS